MSKVFEIVRIPDNQSTYWGNMISEPMDGSLNQECIDQINKVKEYISFIKAYSFLNVVDVVPISDALEKLDADCNEKLLKK